MLFLPCDQNAHRFCPFLEVVSKLFEARIWKNEEEVGSALRRPTRSSVPTVEHMHTVAAVSLPIRPLSLFLCFVGSSQPKQRKEKDVSMTIRRYFLATVSSLSPFLPPVVGGDGSDDP